MRKTHLLIASLIAVIGIMMLIAPSECIKISVIVLGIASIINGIYTLFTVRALVSDSAFQTTMTVRGIVSLVVGALAIILPLAFAGILWTVMVYIIAAYLLLSAFSEIYGTKKMKEASIETKPYRIEIAASIILALLLFCMPAKIGVILIRIGGVILIIVSAVCIYMEWKNKPLVLEAEILSDTNQD